MPEIPRQYPACCPLHPILSSTRRDPNHSLFFAPQIVNLQGDSKLPLILGKMVKILPKDWETLYHHPLYYLETFVDQERFHGTCYRAANWLTIGQTTGRGKNDQTGKANRSLKDVLGYPLSTDFRYHLCGGQA